MKAEHSHAQAQGLAPVSVGAAETFGSSWWSKVTVLADAAERADEIELERAEEAVQRAEQRISTRDADLNLERALGSLRRAQVRVSVARRRRSRGNQPPAGTPQAPSA